jgi:hypothetical protein
MYLCNFVPNKRQILYFRRNIEINIEKALYSRQRTILGMGNIIRRKFLCQKPATYLQKMGEKSGQLCSTFQRTKLKGTVQRQLTGGLSGINRKHMTCHCSDGYPFLIF